MGICLDFGVRAFPDKVAEAAKELQQQGRRVRFGVWLHHAYELTCQTVKSFRRHNRPCVRISLRGRILDSRFRPSI